MTLIAFGINHKTAPVEIREKVAFVPEKIAHALHECIDKGEVSEAVIISTCNRTELYFNLVDNNSNENELNIQNIANQFEWFCQYHQLKKEDIEPYIYLHSNDSAVKHILRVACGLDSLVLGEPQILGQIKDAYSTAKQAGTIGRQLNHLFEHAFSVAKQVRTDTAIGANPVSIAYAAVSLAKRIFADLSEHTVLLIGAGETTELVARHLVDQGVKKIIVANRTIARAQKLAQIFDAEAITLSDIPNRLVEADIIITATASQLPLLGKGAVESALKLRKHRPIFMVDIAVPRDIEPEVGDLDDVYLYTVDDLHEVIKEGRQSRKEAAIQAEEIIIHQVDHFMGWLRSLDGVDVIRSFRQQAELKRDEQLILAKKQLAAGKDPEQVMHDLARTLTNKLIHEPTTQLNQAAYSGRKDLLELARELFNLETEK